MITIDGSQGEGGGQVLRTALALSLVTGQAFRLQKIRAQRSKPGLLNQHLTAVQAAGTVGQAEVIGAALGAQSVEFHPGKVLPGHYQFDVGTAGSATLVLQTILPPLLTAHGVSDLTLQGGTHNPHAPPFDFLAECFMPLMERMGPRVELELYRHGFFPAGGGKFRARIHPSTALSRIDLLQRGAVVRRHARSILSRLPNHVAQRELSIVREKLGWREEQCFMETVEKPAGPGNALLLTFETPHLKEVFTGFGERGRTAEAVAHDAIAAASHWLNAEAPVDEHLADQLLLPMALAGGGSFRTIQPSSHSTTNASIIQRFLPVNITFQPETPTTWKVVVTTS